MFVAGMRSGFAIIYHTRTHTCGGACTHMRLYKNTTHTHTHTRHKHKGTCTHRQTHRLTNTHTNAHNVPEEEAAAGMRCPHCVARSSAYTPAFVFFPFIFFRRQSTRVLYFVSVRSNHSSCCVARSSAYTPALRYYIEVLNNCIKVLY